MKKKLLFGFTTAVCGLLLLTGCGSSNKVVCSSTLESTTGKKVEYEVTAEIDSDNKIKSVTAAFIYESEEDANDAYDSFKERKASVEAEGEILDYDVTKSGKKLIVGSTGEFEKLIGYSKDDFVKELTTDDESTTGMKFTCE